MSPFVDDWNTKLHYCRFSTLGNITSEAPIGSKEFKMNTSCVVVGVHGDSMEEYYERQQYLIGEVRSFNNHL